MISRGACWFGMLSALALGCAKGPSLAEPKPAAPASASAGAPAAAASASATSVAWRYAVRFEGGRYLAVDATFAAGTAELFSADSEAASFVSRMEFAQGDTWRAAAKQGAAWRVPCASGCRIRYGFALREATTTLNEADTAIAAGDVLIAPASTWLLHPESAPAASEFELHVETEAGQHFVTAFQPAPGGRADTYRAATRVLDDASFAAFGPLQVSRVPAGDGSVLLAVAPQGLGLSLEQAQSWVSSSAGAVASYYQGRLPAQRSLVLLMKGGGDATRGLTLGGGGPAVLVRASDRVKPSNLLEDWVVTHELLHANFPDLGYEHAWLSEGLATYIEPIARARVGLLSEATVWKDMLEGLPQGLPQAGDQGLENTHTWGRTYWGGALFCLVADVTLRERTGNHRSLDDVLLAIGKASATDEHEWPLERVLTEAESSTGTPVLRDLYEQLAKKPGNVDLSVLFARLGVRAQGGTVVFDNAAPLANIRRSIAARRPG